VRILIFTQYFTPEVGATSTRLHTFAAGLAERGHEVEVICEVPNHPRGVVHDGYRGRPVVRRSLDGFHASHVWVHTRAVKTTRTRLAFYASYAAMAALVGASRPRPDVVLASSPPLSVAAAAAAVAARHRVPWVFDVRDLWPTAAVALGELSNPRLLRLAEALERQLYENAAAITAVTEPFRRHIAARVSRAEKVSVLPNGTSRLWTDGAKLEVDRAELHLPADRFIWTFAGNVGAAQGLEAAIDAAALLDDRFRLLVLGDGPARPSLEERAHSGRKEAIEFRDQVAPAEALKYLRASDALLVPLAPDPVLASFVPSKLFDFCAVGRPVIVAAAGEAQRLAVAGGAALGVPPGNATALATALSEVADNDALCRRLADAGRRFGLVNLREHHAAKMAQLLGRLAAS
jgi:glycosyltransferase involved in cell wall biosynthesis